MSKKNAAALTLSSCPLQSFLESCRVAKGDTYNFTSIAKPFGSYYVPDARMQDFYQLYCDTIEKHSLMPFLTEKPGPFSPILVDLDFKYDLSVTSRQYDDTFVKQFVQEYFNYIGQYIELDAENGQCYVFERPGPYKTAKNTKDGCHAMFPFIYCPTSLKLLARDNLITEHAAMFQELGTLNSVSDIVDRAVIDQNNWFMFGSGKPGCEPYSLTRIIDFEGNEVANEKPFRELVPMLSVKGKTLPDVRYKDNMEDVLAARFEQLNDAKFRQEIKEVQKQRTQANIRIRSKFEQCTNLPFVRKLVTLLSKSRADDYQDWIQVGWCLHNIDDRLEIINEDGQREPSLLQSWIDFSKRSEKYEEGCCDKRWSQMRQGGLGMGSLVRWAKNDDSDSFDQARGEDIRELIDKSAMSGGAHHSVAKVLYAMYRYQFICVSRKFRTWVEFRTHRWVRIEEAYSLQTKLSNELYGEYSKVQIELANRITQTPDLAEKEMYEKKKTIFSKIGTNLLQTTYKKNVMIEAAELFYCEGLEEKLDTNRNLLSFENGVYDLAASEFRDGRPEDYITLSTGIDYVPYDPKDASVKTVYKIFSQIHVDPNIREYIFMLLASFLSGDNKSQKFHIWTGEAGCHAPGTEIMMWGGGTKSVEAVKVGDQLMGDDGTARSVQNLFHGTEMMYKVTTSRGDSYVVNESHKLALRNTAKPFIRKARKGFQVAWCHKDLYLNLPGATKLVRWRGKNFATKEEAEAYLADVVRNDPCFVDKGDCVQIPVLDYMSIKPSTQLTLPGYQAACEYPERELRVDPFFVGYWLGDGTKNATDITSADIEIVEETNRILAAHGMRLKSMSGKQYGYRFESSDGDGSAFNNVFRTSMQEYGIMAKRFIKGAAGDLKHIPDEYLYSSKAQRLQLLAGIIDSDGNYQQNNQQYEITLKNETLHDDVIQLARSLGFSAFKRYVQKTCTNGRNGPVTGTYCRTLVYGVGLEHIPVRIPRKKADGNRTTVRDNLTSTLTVEAVGEGEYYGFEVDGNHLYMDAQNYVQCNSNGKSLSVDMFMHALGNYAAIMPISLLTSKRSASNSATPELARTKGRRFCVLQEPEQEARVNCGLLKELSGGDSIVTRELYGPIMQFTPQFKMVLTCNRLPEIPSQDGGTWRRIRVVEFQSKFCDEPDPNNPREFKIDNTFSTRMDELSTALLSICVHYYQKYKELGCKVQEPDCVMQFTKQYQQRSDNLLDFINAHIVNTGVKTDILRIGEIYVLFKDWYRANIGDGARVPNCKELKEYLESKFGKCSHSSWRGYAIKVGQDEQDPDE